MMHDVTAGDSWLSHCLRLSVERVQMSYFGMKGLLWEVFFHSNSLFLVLHLTLRHTSIIIEDRGLQHLVACFVMCMLDK